MIDTTLERNLIHDLPEFDKHTLISFLNDERSGMKGYVVIHRKNNETPSFGATRMWNYSSDIGALQDALRLSKMMSYKAALAGLKCGGAKGVIMYPPNEQKNRTEILRAYAQKIRLLKEHFVTGTDVGLSQTDLGVMREYTTNVVGFNDNSTEFTSLGIFCSIECSLREVFGTSELSGRTFAIQGLGKVGSELLKLLYGKAAKIYASEINEQKIERIKNRFPEVIIVKPAAIHRQKVDVYSPCALSNSLNSKTIAELRCKMIVGGANNQLENESIGDLLYKLGILYAPDYVVNSGGLIAVFDEYGNNRYDRNKVMEKVMKIKDRLNDILKKSAAEKRSTNAIANKMAEGIFNTYERA